MMAQRQAGRRAGANGNAGGFRAQARHMDCLENAKKQFSSLMEVCSEIRSSMDGMHEMSLHKRVNALLDLRRISSEVEEAVGDLVRARGFTYRGKGGKLSSTRARLLRFLDYVEGRRGTQAREYDWVGKSIAKLKKARDMLAECAPILKWRIEMRGWMESMEEWELEDQVRTYMHTPEKGAEAKQSVLEAVWAIKSKKLLLELASVRGNNLEGRIASDFVMRAVAERLGKERLEELLMKHHGECYALDALGQDALLRIATLGEEYWYALKRLDEPHLKELLGMGVEGLARAISRRMAKDSAESSWQEIRDRPPEKSIEGMIRERAEWVDYLAKTEALKRRGKAAWRLVGLNPEYAHEELLLQEEFSGMWNFALMRMGDEGLDRVVNENGLAEVREQALKLKEERAEARRREKEAEAKWEAGRAAQREGMERRALLKSYGNPLHGKRGLKLHAMHEQIMKVWKAEKELEDVISRKKEVGQPKIDIDAGIYEKPTMLVEVRRKVPNWNSNNPWYTWEEREKPWVARDRARLSKEEAGAREGLEYARSKAEKKILGVLEEYAHDPAFMAEAGRVVKVASRDMREGVFREIKRRRPMADGIEAMQRSIFEAGKKE